MKKFGLIGFPLKHSFSKRYFTEKFEREGLEDCQYEMFEIESIGKIRQVLDDNPDLVGLNVTIPYKLEVMPFLDEIDPVAKEIGAVNTIKFKSGGKRIGYNTDYLGFKISLEKRLRDPLTTYKALVLGTGGASKAVVAALKDLGIDYKYISRTTSKDAISYQQLNSSPEILNTHRLIINTTPLGTSPNVNAAPDIPYEWISDQHFLYDLVYNPAETRFLMNGKAKGADIKNGLEMLELQAEKAWEIWNS